jgi:F0F1-type ATP synthase membrane subunit c/vacuolar-type H+-ATPase subunit K
MFNFLIYILCKSNHCGAGLIVIGAGLGIGKLVVQQWTLLLVTRSFRKIQTAMLIAAAIEGIGFAALFVSLIKKKQ